MRVPISWLDDALRPGPRAGGARRAPVDDRHRGRADRPARRASTDGFVVGRVAHRRAPSGCRPAQGLHGRHRRRASRGRSSAAPPTSPPARPSPSRCPGAVMPDGTKLGKAKLRGVESAGMILSETEMELGEDSDGIAVLDGVEAGRRRRRSPTCCRSPSRCSSSRSPRTAPTASASTASPARSTRSRGAELAEPPWDDRRRGDRGRRGLRASPRSRVEVPELCPRFTARAFTDVEIGPSPLWLKARLIAAGQRPINNVVDITNYVMLLTGQPLHAFDLDEVPGRRDHRPGGRRGRADDDARRRRADARRRDASSSATATDRRGSPGSWAARSPRSPSRRPGCCSRPRPGTAPTSCAPRTCSALRSEASTRFEKQLHPDLTMRAQRGRLAAAGRALRRAARAGHDRRRRAASADARRSS